MKHHITAYLVDTVSLVWADTVSMAAQRVIFNQYCLEYPTNRTVQQWARIMNGGRQWLAVEKNGHERWRNDHDGER